MTNIVNSS